MGRPRTSVIAWTLNNGEGMALILVVDRTLLLGRGRDANGFDGLTYRHKEYATPEEAQEAGLQTTRHMEIDGYKLHLHPKRHSFPLGVSVVTDYLTLRPAMRRTIIGTMFSDGDLS